MSIEELREIISVGLVDAGYQRAAVEMWAMDDRRFVAMIPVWANLFEFVDSGLAHYLDAVYPMIRRYH